LRTPGAQRWETKQLACEKGVDFVDLPAIGLIALAVSAAEVKIGEVSKEAAHKH